MIVPLAPLPGAPPRANSRRTSARVALALVGLALHGGCTSRGGMTEATGGTGGEPFVQACPIGSIAAGLRVKATAFVESIELACDDGAIPIGPGRAGQATGRLVEATCGVGEVLVGLEGRSGALIDQVAVVCARRDARARGERGTRRLGTWGGAGGLPFALLCPEGEAVTTLVGRAATHVQRLALGCAPLSS